MPFTCALLVVASSAALAASSSPFRQATARSMVQGYAADPLAADSARLGEQAFLQKAADTGRLQMRLAELGASQATSAEVRGHAEQLKSDNRQLVDGLTALMRRKGVGEVPPGTSPGAPTGRAAIDPYSRLAQRGGADFDREFVRVMADLHEETISLFELAAADSKDPDVRALAAAQLPMLRAHRNRITELKKIYD